MRRACDLLCHDRLAAAAAAELTPLPALRPHHAQVEYGLIDAVVSKPSLMMA